MSNQWVFEAVLDEQVYWPGNELYDTLEYAKFCIQQDYEESFPEARDKYMTWKLVNKALYHMYLNQVPTGVAIHVRHVNSLGR